MKVWALIYCDYEATDTMGIFSSRELAEDAFRSNVTEKLDDDVISLLNDPERYRIIEFEIDKWEGAAHYSWDEEAMIKLRDAK